MSIEELNKDLKYRHKLMVQHEMKYAPKGFTIQALADKHDMTWNTVKKRNIILNLNRQLPDFDSVEEEIKAGKLSNEKIAIKYGVDVKTIYNRKKKLGLTGKRGSNQWTKKVIDEN